MGLVLLGAGIMFVGVLFGAVLAAAIISSDKPATPLGSESAALKFSSKEDKK